MHAMGCPIPAILTVNNSNFPNMINPIAAARKAYVGVVDYLRCRASVLSILPNISLTTLNGSETGVWTARVRVVEDMCTTHPAAK